MKLLTTSLALALAACSAQGPTEPLGTVDFAITTPGSDGYTYRLTPGTRLALATTSPSGLPNYDVNLDGDGTTVSFRAVPGDYEATLYNVSGDYTTEWPVERIEDGATVNAQLLTAMPLAVTVTGGMPTNIAFQFAVTGGTFIFGRSNVDVTVGIDPASGYTASASGTGDVSGTPRVDGPNVTALESLMPAEGDTGLDLSLIGHMTGQWTDTGATVDPDGLFAAVCAPFAIDGYSAGGNTGLLDLLAEATAVGGTAPNYLFGTADICVIDNGASLPNQIWVRASREGAAGTQDFQDIFGTAPAAWYARLVGDLPTRLYDNDTGVFDSDGLLGTQSLPVTMRIMILDDTNFPIIWYYANITGTETFSFSAQ